MMNWIISDDGQWMTPTAISRILKWCQDKITSQYFRQKRTNWKFWECVGWQAWVILYFCRSNICWCRVESMLNYYINMDLVILMLLWLMRPGCYLSSSLLIQRGSKSGFINNVKFATHIYCCTSFRKKLLNRVPFLPKFICMIGG